MNIFEQATRFKLRFDSPKGMLSVEDLWSIPLTAANKDKANLDDIARALHHKTREMADSVSYVNPTTNIADETVALSFEIVKHIIGVRLEENRKTQEAANRRELKQRLQEIIASKEDKALSDKSVDELRAMVASMG